MPPEQVGKKKTCHKKNIVDRSRGILTGSAPARFAGIPGIAVSSLKTLTCHFLGDPGVAGVRSTGVH